MSLFSLLRIAILSDPHGDFLAFRKAIADLESAGPFDEVLLGGDLAQGGAQPSEVVDDIRRRGWRSVRGNADDLLVRIADGMSDDDVLQPARRTHERLAPDTASRAHWSVERLGRERIEYLRSLPTSIQLGPFGAGTVMLVHATPWSTEDVILPDAALEVAARMVRESGARFVAYGHIHTPYQRRVGDAVVASVGAVSGSNDQDPRPAYTIVEVDKTISAEVRRVDWPSSERQIDYAREGIDERFIRDKPGPFPVRSTPGELVQIWPWADPDVEVT